MLMVCLALLMSAPIQAKVLNKRDGVNYYFGQKETYYNLPMNRIYDETKIGDIVYSGGAGLKIAMNQNFIVSVEVAHCFYQPLNADLWIGIGINYQF